MSTGADLSIRHSQHSGVNIDSLHAAQWIMVFTDHSAEIATGGGSPPCCCSMARAVVGVKQVFHWFALR